MSKGTGKAFFIGSRMQQKLCHPINNCRISERAVKDGVKDDIVYSSTSVVDPARKVELIVIEQAEHRGEGQILCSCSMQPYGLSYHFKNGLVQSSAEWHDLLPVGRVSSILLLKVVQ